MEQEEIKEELKGRSPVQPSMTDNISSRLEDLHSSVVNIVRSFQAEADQEVDDDADEIEDETKEVEAKNEDDNDEDDDDVEVETVLEGDEVTTAGIKNLGEESTVESTRGATEAAAATTVEETTTGLAGRV